LLWLLYSDNIGDNYGNSKYSKCNKYKPIHNLWAVTTSATDVIDVPADKLYKINTILIANIDGTNAADISVEYQLIMVLIIMTLASTISVPADSTLSLLSTTLYLDETDLLRVQLVLIVI
jgi:hypothetical protein